MSWFEDFTGLGEKLLGSFADCAPQGMTPIENVSGNNTESSIGVSKPPPVALNPNEPSLTRNPSKAGAYGATELAQPYQTPESQPTAPTVTQKTWDGRTNPGPFDKADSDALRILKPDIYDGCRFEHNKGLGQQFSVSHSLWLGSAMLQSGNNYNFGTTLVLNEGRTMMLGRMSDDLRLDAQIHHEIIQPQRLIARIVSSIGAENAQSVTHATLETNGIDFNANIKLAKGPLLAVSYFQSVTKWLNLGAEAFHHAGQGVSHVFCRANANLNDKKDIINATVSTMGAMSFNYVRKVNDRVSLAAELDFSAATSQTSMNVGYEFLLRQTKISGVVSTEGMIQNQITEAVAPGFHIVFNSILDHKRDTHRFGYGVQIG